MKKKHLLLLALLISIITASFIVIISTRPSEYNPEHPLLGASCGGDWSYDVECPAGTYCKDLGQGPLAGGKCAPLNE